MKGKHVSKAYRKVSLPFSCLCHFAPVLCCATCQLCASAIVLGYLLRVQRKYSLIGLNQYVRNINSIQAYVASLPCLGFTVPILGHTLQDF